MHTKKINYTLLHRKSKGELDENTKKQMQIEKIKNVFKDSDNNEKNNNENEKIFNYDYISKEIEPFKNFSLIKNSIGTENIEFQYKNKIEKLLSSKKNNKFNINKEKENIKDNLIREFETENISNTNKIEKNENENESNKNNILNDNVFNITQDQMKIFDNDVNKLYNDHKNNIKLKIFQINHPYLHNIKLINNKVESTSSSMTKEERLFPLLQKQKIILKKIQENNISRSNSSLSKNNNDSIDHSTTNKNNKLNKLLFKRNSKNNNLEIFPPYICKSIDNNILDNFSSSENGKNNSKEKTKLKRNKINFKPYTLEQYINKYENKNPVILGGLGANLGGDEWNKKKDMNERKRIYSDNVKSDNEFRILNKRKINNLIKKNEDAKTATSRKDYSEFSYESYRGNKYKIFKTENNLTNNNNIKLPLINSRFNSNSKIKLKRYKNKSNNKFLIDQEHETEGGEKDLKQLIKQYEEYNEKYKL